MYLTSLEMDKAQAIQHFGGVTKLAHLLGITRQAIYMWPDTVPDLYQYKLHHMSDGELALGVSSPNPQVSPQQ